MTVPENFPSYFYMGQGITIYTGQPISEISSYVLWALKTSQTSRPKDLGPDG